MINYSDSTLFQLDSVDKQITIKFSEYINNPIKNDDIRLDSFELTESLCSDNTLTFGKCESGHVEFDLRKDYPSVNGKQMEILLTPEGGTAIRLGYFTVVSETPQTNSNYKKIVAYDLLYFINNMDITSWWNGIETGTTMANVITSFFTYYSIPYVRTTLLIDGMELTRTQTQSNLSGSDFIRSVCEMCGMFGHIDRNGYFSFVKLDVSVNGLYPSSTVYPSSSVLPNQAVNSGLSASLYESVEYESFRVKKIDGVAVDCSVGTVQFADDGAQNVYKVKANLIMQEQSETDAKYYAQMMYYAIAMVEYTPIKKMQSKGNPCIEVGDFIAVADSDNVNVVNTYVFTRTMKGITALSDELVSKGTEEQPAVQNLKPKETQREIERQKVEVQKNTTEIQKLTAQQLKIVWVNSASQVGSDAYTFYCVPK